jgi:hypothetical protein
VNFLENYNRISVDDKVIASFRLELHQLLDGSSKELKRKFSMMQNTEIPVVVDMVQSKKDAKKKESSRSSKTEANDKSK